MNWVVSADSISRRARQHGTNTARPDQAHSRRERTIRLSPLRYTDGHAAGRSRGELGSKVQVAVHGNGVPLAIVFTKGATTELSSWKSSMTSGFLAWALVGHGPGPTPLSVTRPSHLVRTVGCSRYVGGESPEVRRARRLHEAGVPR